MRRCGKIKCRVMVSTVQQIKEMSMLHQDIRQSVPEYTAFLPSTLRWAVMTTRALLGLLLVSTAAAASNDCLDFSAHPASNAYDGPRVTPIIEKGNSASRYRTTIRRGADGPPNFAGHFRVVTCGCGSDCHDLALVDIETGSVCLVERLHAAVGYEYHLDSSLLLSDTASMISGWKPGDPTAFEFSSESYVWDDSKRILTRLPECKGNAQRN